MVGVTGPLYRMFVAPEVATPIDANVIATTVGSVGPVAIGKSTFDTGLVLCDVDAVIPPVVRATLTRAYPAYVASDAF
jgi:hypothetical protein